jgi:hypothetical protein
MLMSIFYDRISPAFTVGSTHHENGKFPLKLYQLLKNPSGSRPFNCPQRPGDFIDIRIVSEWPLAFPIVTGCRGLTESRNTDVFDGFHQLIRRPYGKKSDNGKAVRAQKPLLSTALEGRTQ